MEKQIIFWILILISVLIISGIVIIGNSIKIFIKSDIFKKKLELKENKIKNGSKAITSLCLLILSSSSAFAGGSLEYTPFINITDDQLWAVLILNIVLLLIMMYLKSIYSSLNNIDKTEEEIVKKKKESHINLSQIFTDRVNIEDEESILMEHNYDGIMELDNNLPPWWKWGFYLTIFISVIYLANYHVFGVGMLQEEAYEKEMVKADEDIKAYLVAQAMDVDENSVTLLDDSKDLNKGKELFTQYCSVCHGMLGEGIVGPNLTDDYWIHGGSIADIFKVIKYGAQNGMKSWKDELNPIEMQQVSSYIKQLKGTNPPNQKELQGEYYEEIDIKADSNEIANQ